MSNLKSYQLDGIQAYITGVTSKQQASIILITCCKWGVLPEDLVEVERVPKGVPHYSPANRPAFDPTSPVCIDLTIS